MEAAITNAAAEVRASNFTGSVEAARQFFSAPLTNLHAIAATTLRARLRASDPNADRGRGATRLMFVKEQSEGERIFDAIQSLYLSTNRPRDRQIAERITELHRVILAEGEHIMPASLEQFTDFFLNHPALNFPRITMTPDNTLRARWIHGPENFVAIEFTGEALVRMVGEVPRGGQTAAYFMSEPVESVVASGRAIGAAF